MWTRNIVQRRPPSFRSCFALADAGGIPHAVANSRRHAVSNPYTKLNHALATSAAEWMGKLHQFVH